MKYLLLGIVPGLVHFESYMVVPNPVGGNYQCIYCGTFHAQRSTARSHVIKSHIAPERFICNICNEVVKHKFLLTKHMMQKHNMKGVGNVSAKYSTKVRDVMN